MALTGVLLGLKDILGLKPRTAKAEVVSLNEWVSLQQINTNAIAYAKAQQLDTLIDRVDVRIDKGIAKVLFKRHFTELQLAGSTGEILSVRQRGDHFIERIHDGSIVEFYAQQTDAVKMIYSSRNWTSGPLDERLFFMGCSEKETSQKRLRFLLGGP